MRSTIPTAALGVIASLGAIGLCARPAAAAELLLTYTGTANDPNNATDDLSLFGGLIYGKTMVVRMLIQTDAAPGATASISSDPYYTYSDLTGTGAASPVLSESVTVGGVTTDLCSAVGQCGAPDTNGDLNKGDPFFPNDPALAEYWTSGLDGDAWGAKIYLYDDSNRLPHGSDLSLPAGTYATADGYGLFASFTVFGPPDQDGNPLFTYAWSTDGALTIQAVPEPAAWPLMIGGFGLTGAALRRRRAIAA